MSHMMINEDSNNIYDLNSEEWRKIIESLNEEDSLSVDEILEEINDELSKHSSTQVPVTVDPQLDISPDPMTIFTNNIQNFGEYPFVGVHDQGVNLVHSHVLTPFNDVRAGHNIILPSPRNTTFSNHIESGWIQMSNNSNHLSSYKYKPHCKRYERWTENEHRLFLLGLKSCGEGNWKSISELYVVSKSPSQVSSHAQKYKIHQKTSMQNKKRKSIHEISIEPSKHVIPTPVTSLEEILSKDDVLNCANHMENYNNSIVTVPRKKCKHWTEDEHKLFLLGHAKYQENWKEVSKNFVPSKTPTQIASHAQKYFLRQNVPEHQRKRKSIHDKTLQDITSIVAHSYIWVPPELLNDK
ncbi:hypothetical protein V8G54_033875 [Vigna mungo]|uniref:Uncharacterized protein n=1 Tax=Vigna mungo TaxID=3915 RepID=A0AAQ3MP75_VIGMU